jgi:OOP family OmpA-OmpF porin
VVAAGIGEERIIAIGLGPDRPIAPNDVEINRAKNRRVEMRLTKL